jgi:hypothetical protein
MKILIALTLSMMCLSAHGSLLLSSPTGQGDLHASIPDFGGAVIDIVGKNNNRVLSFISERELAHVGLVTDSNGYASTTIGALSFTDEMLNALIGGIDQIAIRLTMWDGDNSLLDGVAQGFHANKNYLYANGVNAGNFSNIETQAFERFGTNTVSTPGTTGFVTDLTAVGWFSINESAMLDAIYTSIFGTRNLALDFVIEGAAANHANFISFSDRDDRLTRQVKSFNVIKVPEPKTLLIIMILFMYLSCKYIYKKQAKTSFNP